MKRLVTHIRRFCSGKSEDGSIAVEFATISPVLLIMLLGVIEVSSAINQNLSVHAAARAGTDFGLTKPPVNGDVQPIINAAKASMPTSWSSDGSNPDVKASLVCECEVTGAVACGGQCAAGERMQTYLKVDVTKAYTPVVNFRFMSSSMKFSNTSQIRLN